ncbi:MAG TPA: polysaccharide deacetylase family protein [Actinomycetota bacterium]|jgi:peptidoglycan-N-acetylglucosamine deacetylase|nr:polysaccharide deacetylase family protein [Actinomycetota bacterium]
MDRRHFIGLLGAGAAGGAGLVARRVAGDDVEPAGTRVTEDVEPTARGQQRIIWSVDTPRPVAALTFDDGPDPEFTPRILDVLAEHDVRATFMVMTHNAIAHPRLLRRMVAEGHEVGGHGWNHLNLTELRYDQVYREVERGTRLVEDLAGVPIRVFRPPYGRFSQAAVQVLGQTERDLVVWSVTRGDLGWTEPRQIARHVLDETGPGDIIDLHDGIGRGTFNRDYKFAERLRRRREVELAALPRVLDGFRSNGLELATVSELLTVGGRSTA